MTWSAPAANIALRQATIFDVKLAVYSTVLHWGIAITTSPTLRAAAMLLLIVVLFSGITPADLLVATAEPGAPFQATNEKRMPRTVITAGLAAAARVRPPPMCLMPLSSNASIVSPTPASPALVMWSVPIVA